MVIIYFTIKAPHHVLEHLLIPSGKSASTNHSPNKSIGSRSLSETDPLAQVLPPRTRRCRHPGLAAAPGPPIVSALLHFPLFCFPHANSFSFFSRRPQQASWFFGSWGTTAGPLFFTCRSLSKGSPAAVQCPEHTTICSRNSSGTSSLWRPRGQAGETSSPEATTMRLRASVPCST
jgi:hypothetical protein